MKIRTVTVTGADDSIPPEFLETIAGDYPFVEFGILLSKNSVGHRRFPSIEWLRKMRKVAPNVKLSGHICGSWVRQIFQGDWPMSELRYMLGNDCFQRFGRWQLNTHGIYHDWNDHFLLTLPRHGKSSVIFQYDEVNKDVVAEARKRGLENIAALFDLSHGAGALPTSWPEKLHGLYCGYAGGLSPENVAEQCRQIAGVVGEEEIWIDAETHLRSSDDAVFNVDKVMAFLAAAQPFVAA